ncbi:MAG: hypothetical protein ACI91O_000803 [Candidatus Poriferisodalaceae bacterium]|jgi:hypothetical protein
MTDQAAPAVYLGDAREIQRVVAPITLQRRYEVGVAYAVRLADLWNLPVHLVSVDTEGSSETAADLMSGATIVTETSSAAADLADLLQPSDRVVMSTAADADPTDSFAQEFVHLWAGPTILLGPEVDSEASLEGDVALGVDGSAMAERAAPIAVALAHLLGAHLRFVRSAQCPVVVIRPVGLTPVAIAA